MKSLKLWPIILILSFVSGFEIAACKPNQEFIVEPSLHPNYSQDLQGAIDQVLIENSEYNLGISAAVKVPGFQTWTGVAGLSHPNTPVTDDMLFDIGSIAKNFEAALILRFAEEGKLSLDDPISKYLPNFPQVDPQISIRQLLNHTSGVFNVFEHPDFPWVGTEVNYSKAWTISEVFDTLVLEPYGPPGYTQHYSSTNYLLLTAILEKVTARTIPEEIEDQFLEPLEMDSTFMSMGEWPPPTHLVAHPWVDVNLDGILDDVHGIPLTWKATLTHPVMFVTPSDLTKWTHTLFYEKTVLHSNSLAAMLTIPEVTISDSEGGRYGLGIVDFTDLLGVSVIGHGGSSLGYSAAALYFPDSGISVAWVINTGESPRSLANQMMYQTWIGISEVVFSDQNDK